MSGPAGREPVRRPPLFGAHMSVAGGLPRAVERAVVHGCDALQIFTKNASQWRGRELPPEEVRAFRTAVREAGLAAVVSHASYLINLAAADRGLRRQSLRAMADEIDRAERLGLLGVVLHPGCYTSGEPDRGLALVGRALTTLLRRAPGQTMVLLEQTAGQGTSLGWSFEQLAAIIEHVEGHPRVGVCLDTCHLLAAGYDLTTDEGYAATFAAFERLIGLERLRALHLNDSKRPLGSRVDRHEHIGGGYLGTGAFRRIVNDRRFAGLPMLLETPKSDTRATGPIRPDPLDVKNLTLLRSLLAG
ncbi:MAG: deoxyribonuclease IV [Vicinamibacterales bacterium]